MFLLKIILVIQVAYLALSTGNSVSNESSSAEHDCSGRIGNRCLHPSTCKKDFRNKCQSGDGVCCPVSRKNGVELGSLSTATNCRNRKCKRFYRGNFVTTCKLPKRSLYICPKNNKICCAGPCERLPLCASLGGECVTLRNRCDGDGRVIANQCKGSQCYCCVKGSKPTPPPPTPPPPKPTTTPTTTPDTTTTPLDSTTTTPVPTCPKNGNTGESCTGHRDCAEHFDAGGTSSGITTICPISTCNPMQVYCDGKWTVFVSRDSNHLDNENFERSWDEYKEGFGDCGQEYWLGNEILYNLTNSEPYIMRIVGTDSSGGTRSAIYNSFTVDNEANKYRLSIAGYDGSSTMSDVLTLPSQPKTNLNGMAFSTTDMDNDNLSGSCSNYFNKGGGFWYNSCSLITPTRNPEVRCYFWDAGIAGPEILTKLTMAIRPL